jgi:SAM-dependent methyltransferase
MKSGGYQDGYRACPCFWGTEPAESVQELADLLSELPAPRVLDVGCGEGKNAFYLASQGIKVDAFDISELAISNAINAWSEVAGLRWHVADLATYPLLENSYNAIIATGSLHCLISKNSVEKAIARIKLATAPGGYNVISVFNDRAQDLSGHSGDFDPVLLPHSYYTSIYSDWTLLHALDTDLHDFHAHIRKRHFHSITRILARKPRPR